MLKLNHVGHIARRMFCTASIVALPLLVLPGCDQPAPDGRKQGDAATTVENGLVNVGEKAFVNGAGSELGRKAADAMIDRPAVDPTPLVAPEGGASVIEQILEAIF